MSDLPPVVNNENASRYELVADGIVAELVYERRGDKLVLVHTGVPAELEGRGVGGKLVSAAIEDAADKSLSVVARCPFAREWLKRHPDVAERVPIVSA